MSDALAINAAIREIAAIGDIETELKNHLTELDFARAFHQANHDLKLIRLKAAIACRDQVSKELGFDVSTVVSVDVATNTVVIK